MLALLATLLIAPGARLAATDDPQLPPLADRQKAAAAVAEVFSTDAARAKTPAELTKLAVLIRKGANTEKERATKWAMLDYARGLAAQAGDAKLIFELVGELQSDFGAGAEASIDTGEKLVKSGRATPELVDLMLNFVDAAHSKDDYAATERIAGGGLTMANTIRDTAAARYFTFAQKRAAELGKRYADVKKDPEALAKFYFFEKQDLRGALPFLAKSKDAKLAETATKDMKADRNSASELVAVGDAWWQLAESTPAAERYPVFLAAGAAYNRAFADLTGLEKAKVETRSRQIFEAVEVEEARNGLFLSYVGTWEFQDKEGVSREFTVHRSGRVTFENPSGERMYLARSGKEVVLKHKRETSRWALTADTLALKLFTPEGKPTGTVTAKRK